MRFLRGQKLNVDDATQMYRNFLQWRKENDIDGIRHEILYNGKNCADKFPKAETIMKIVPQIVIAPNARDNSGQPIVFEELGFRAHSLFEHISMEDLGLFFMYSLEFRAMILEQLSEESEKAYLAQHPDPASREDEYGVMHRLCVIRDLKGVGFDTLGSEFKSVVKKFAEIGARK
jgi:hypothetical protein